METPGPAPVRRRTSIRRRAMIYLLILLVLYLSWLIVVFMIQHALIFPRWAITRAPLIGPPVGYEEVYVDTDQGRVEGWFLRSVVGDDVGPRGVVVMFHGNGMLIDDWLAEAGWFASLGWHVLLPEYRGYGRSAGDPTQDRLESDMADFLRQLHERDDVRSDLIVYYGRSIGASLAAQVAEDAPPAGMILQTPPASIADMAWRYGAPPFLVRSPFDTTSALRELGEVPVLVIEHNADRIVPASDCRRVLASAPHARHLLLEGDHNVLSDGRQRRLFMDEVEAFLDACSEPAPEG